MNGWNLQGKIAFIAGIGDDQGYGWAIFRALVEAGAKVIIGTWTPVFKLFNQSWSLGKFDASRKLPDGNLMEYLKVYSLDAMFDRPEDVPQETRENKRYQDSSGYTISEVATQVEKEFGKIDIFVHSLANAPEVKKPLLETSRQGYLAALSASSYSLIGLLQHFGPIMNRGGACLALTYIASERAVPGYGGGMSSAKAALESDVRTLAWEMGRKWGLRINALSLGPWRSRAAKAIGTGFIDDMIRYSQANAPLQHEMEAEDAGQAACFLLSPQARSITGVNLYVDCGLHAMGFAVDSATFQGTERMSL